MEEELWSMTIFNFGPEQGGGGDQLKKPTLALFGGWFYVLQSLLKILVAFGLALVHFWICSFPPSFNEIGIDQRRVDG